MKPRTFDQQSSNARNVIIVPLGTTPIQTVQVLRTWEMMVGLALDDRAKVVAFDAQDVEHRSPKPTVRRDFQDITLMSNELVRGAVGDRESRRKAEKRGRFWMTLPTFCDDPGVAGGKIGAGGIGRIGRLVYAQNERAFGSQIVNCLRRCQDYQQQATAITKNLNATELPVIRLYVLASCVGGTGDGAFFAALETIAEKAAELKVNVRITPILILMGTLHPGDQRVAARNQQLVLRSAQAHFEGKFKSLTSSNGDFQILCDPPVLFSNANNYGEMADLKRVIALVGEWLYTSIHTTLGPIFHQEAINLHDQEMEDSSHDLRRAATSGFSGIGLNKEKILAYVINKWVWSFLSSLVEEPESSSALRHASVAMSSMALRETQTDDTAAQRIYCVRSQGNMNVLDRARAVFRQRMGNHMGFRGCRESYNAAHYVIEKELPHSLIPKMADEAVARVRECTETLGSEISRYLQRQTGLVAGRQFLEQMQRLLDESEKANQNKLANAQRYNKDLRQAMAACEKTYYTLQKESPLFRWLHVFMFARFRRTYPRHIEALIRSELDIAARTLLAKKVFPQMRQVLASQHCRLDHIKEAITLLRNFMGQEIDRLQNLSDEFYVPVGYELADLELMGRTFGDTLAAEGGISTAMNKVFDAFCGEYQCLEAFSQRRPQEIGDYLTSYCQSVTHTLVEQLHVLDVFAAAFPAQSQQHEMIDKLIGQSDGRVKTSGEYDQEVPRLKYIIGPDDRTVQWALKIANSIRRLGGDWRGHVDPTVRGIFFMQYRAGVSITQQIRDTMKFYQLPDDPEELAQLGEDPIVAQAPDTDTADDKIDLTIAQALVSGQIHRNGRGCELRQAGSALVLGTVLEEIRAALAASYEARMRIYRQFCLELTQNQEKLLRDIEAIVANHASDGAKLAVSLDKTAFDRVRALAHSLVPYTSRIRLDLHPAHRAPEEGQA